MLPTGQLPKSVGYAIYGPRTSSFNTGTSASLTTTVAGVPTAPPLWTVHWPPSPDLTEDKP